MSAVTETIEPVQRYRDMLEGARDTLPGRELAWLETQRSEARAQFESLGFPHRRQEAWRYSSVEGLLEHPFMPAGGAISAAHQADIQALLRPLADSHRLVVANGRVVPALSRLDGLPSGVRVQSLRDALNSDPEQLSAWLGQAAGPAQHAFSALNSAMLDDGMLLHVAAGCHIDKPIEVVFVGLAAETPVIAQPRSLVVVEDGARATLVERYLSPHEPLYFTNTLLEVLLGADAELDHYRLQDESAKAYHVGSLQVQQARDSRYTATCLALGSAWSRTECKVDFSAPGASAELKGLYLVGDRRLADFHLDVRHAFPDCASRENFKGIVLGRGRAVFDGRILVEKDAQRSDAQLSNSNLLLSPNAEVDTKPQLEIYADDVKCSHGTSVGQLDPQQIFYLRSRGIAEAEARNMLCLGFAGEILDGCSVDGLQQQVQARLSERLAGALSDQVN
jgi:Fe-S cluster assembly protein SufD